MPKAPSGLSPRVRGNRTRSRPSASGSRSIPACAGEPRGDRSSCRRPRVYPRVCGGTASSPWTRPAGAGLSPRVRGNRRRGGPVAIAIGSIPACAGEPLTVAYWWGACRVYPRVCGGTDLVDVIMHRGNGLSPRVRGNLGGHGPAPVRVRSIPACAGEPVVGRPVFYASRVYPRVCGGTFIEAPSADYLGGLSPRVRGNRPAGPVAPANPRSIPACAGEPAVSGMARRGMGVYPRVCGGTCLQYDNERVQYGLSPRVRGNPHRSPCISPKIGSIPACAGEPLGKLIVSIRHHSPRERD